MTVQTKVKALLVKAIEAKRKDLELVESSNWANTGTWYIQPKSGFTQLVTIGYDFQSSSASFSVNKARMYCDYTGGALDSFINTVLGLI
jgi:hypothetical protein